MLQVTYFNNNQSEILVRSRLSGQFICAIGVDGFTLAPACELD